MKPTTILLVGLCSFPLASAGQVPLNLPPPVDGGRRVQELLVPGSGAGFAGFSTVAPTIGPVIYYDSVWIRRLGGIRSAGFRFLRAHEYGHHRLRHVLKQFTTPPAALPSLALETELEADCWATKALTSAGDDEAVRAGIDLYRRVLPNGTGPDGRPGSGARIREIQRCQAKDSTPFTRRREPHPRLPRGRVNTGRSCATLFGTCGPFPNISPLPLGSPCHCGLATGMVVRP